MHFKRFRNIYNSRYSNFKLKTVLQMYNNMRFVQPNLLSRHRLYDVYNNMMLT